MTAERFEAHIQPLVDPVEHQAADLLRQSALQPERKAGQLHTDLKLTLGEKEIDDKRDAVNAIITNHDSFGNDAERQQLRDIFSDANKRGALNGLIEKINDSTGHYRLDRSEDHGSQVISLFLAHPIDSDGRAADQLKF